MRRPTAKGPLRRMEGQRTWSCWRSADLLRRSLHVSRRVDDCNNVGSITTRRCSRLSHVSLRNQAGELRNRNLELHLTTLSGLIGRTKVRMKSCAS